MKSDAVARILTKLRGLDVKLWGEGNQLRFNAPKGVMSTDLRSELAAHKTEILEVLSGTKVSEDQPTSIERVSRDRELSLSFPQQRLWFMDQFEPGSALYNMRFAVRVEGALDETVLKRALEAVVMRHESLRTTFGSKDGVPSQLIAQTMAIPLQNVEVVEPTRLEALLSETARQPFDLAKGPLLRVTLFRLGAQEHVLLLVLHHVVSDAWSMGVLFRELSLLYEAFLARGSSPLAELPIQYADYAAWQRERLQGEVLETQLGYWKKNLSDALRVLELPTDHPRPALQSYRGARHTFVLPKALAEALNALARAHGCTLFMALLAGFYTLLCRYSGQQDMLIGTPIAGRNRTELEGLIGFFVNTLVLRGDLSGDPTFTELLARVRQTALNAYAHSDLPFEKLVEELQPSRDPGRSPLIQVMFALQNVPAQTLDLAGLTLTPLALDIGIAKFDLTLSISERANGLEGVFEYATDLFDPATIERMRGHFRVLLEGIVADPQQRISELPLLTQAERHQILVEWKNTATDFPRDATIPQLFEAQVERTPEAVAVVLEDQQLNYRQLNQRANHVASVLREFGVKPDSLVAICAERSLELVVGLLGILKAGGAYVPLDPSYPKERLAFMLEDTRTSVVLTQRRLVAGMPPSRATIVRLDEINWKENLGSQVNPVTGITADNLAYVIYTSGSTGKPKGVMVGHRAVSRLVINSGYVRLVSSDVVGQVSNCSFDAATFEIWGALLNGAQLALIPREIALDPATLVAAISRERISTLFLTTALFNEVVRARPDAFAGMRHVLFGGEAVDPRWVRACLDAGAPRRLLHVYGPTETTTFATWYPVSAVPAGARTIPIGRPIDNTQLYVLDQHRQPVPIGIAGELYIGGDGLARGYWNRPELTAERFVADPFSAGPARMYRTGDLVRTLADGNIEFLGRLDHQVKLRGFRIELGEIEAALTRHAQVREALVLLREDVAGDKRLVAYMVARQAGLDTSELRAQLKQQLPEYMLPAAFVVLPALPLTPNGKIDRNRLPAPQQEHSEAQADYTAPGNTVEAQLVQIWEEVLGIKPVGIHDNFFDLGGHSLLATQVLFRARDSLQINLSLRVFFECPTVCELAAYISAIVWTTDPDTHISGDEREVGAI